MKTYAQIAFIVGALCLDSRAFASFAASDVTCVGAQSQWRLQTFDGATIGDAIDETACRDAATVSREGTVCARHAGQWHPTSIAYGKAMGTATSFDDCQRAVRAAHADLVCTREASGNQPWRPTQVAYGFALGRFGTSLDDCVELTANAARNVVCTNTGTFGFKGRKPTVIDDKPWSDAKLLGASGQQAFCTQSTRESRSGQVCACNGDFCGATNWILYDLTTRRAVGSTTSLQSCIDSQE